MEIKKRIPMSRPASKQIKQSQEDGFFMGFPVTAKPEVECTILVPQVSSLKSSRVIPLCDLSGGTILQLEVVRHHRSDETR